MTDFLTVEQIAERLQVSYEMVLKLIRAGQLEAHNIASERDSRPTYRISPQAFADYLEKTRVKIASEAKE